jgi:rhodanese-related sulfurtransferase
MLLVAALTVVTVALAHRLQLLADVLLVIGASVLGGLVFIAAHPELGLLASPPDPSDATCGEEIPLVAPVVERISVDDAMTLLGQAQVTFVDARPSYHYTAAHIPGAMNLPAEDADLMLGTQSLPIPPDGQVITYCDGGTCEQSEYLGLLLRERDVCQRVLVLEGGWQAWVTAEGPTVVGDEPMGEVAG